MYSVHESTYISVYTKTIPLQTQRFHAKSVEEQTRDMRQLLKERHVTEQLVADQCSKLMHVVRQANASVRWLFLHTLLVPTCASLSLSLTLTCGFPY